MDEVRFLYNWCILIFLYPWTIYHPFWKKPFSLVSKIPITRLWVSSDLIKSNCSILIIFLHSENYISIFFHIEWDIIVVTILLSILNQMEFHLIQNPKEYCHHDHIPFHVKGNGNIVFSVYANFVYCNQLREPIVASTK